MSTLLKLVVEQADETRQEFRLDSAAVTIGRSPANDIVLADDRVSRNHARIERDGDEYRLVDPGSTNGVLVNGQRLATAPLKAGDRLTIGGSTLVLEADGGSSAGDLDLTQIGSQIDFDATLFSLRMPVELSDTTEPRLAVYTPDRTWEVPITANGVSIGRGPDNDLVLPLPGVSRHHARIEVRRGGAIFLRDLGSSNGTAVNGVKVDEQELSDSDTIRIERAQIVYKKGFLGEELEDFHSAFKTTRRPVILIPAMFGSELYLGRDRVWPNIKKLIAEPEILSLQRGEPLEARSLLNEVTVVPHMVTLEQYSRLRDFLEECLGYERGKDLFEFPYDFREDVRLLGRRLAAAIEGWNLQAPATIISHSLGCMVARYYVERLGGDEHVSRLILMGGPHHGVPKVISILFSGPKLLPFGIFGDRFQRIVSTFPSMYQVLPSYVCGTDDSGRKFNVLTDDNWVAPENLHLLKDARLLRAELGQSSKVPTVSIFGYGISTLARVNVRRDRDGRWLDATYVNDESGDGTTPEISAVFDTNSIHPVKQHHGALYVDKDVKMRLKIELTRDL